MGAALRLKNAPFTDQGDLSVTEAAQRPLVPADTAFTMKHDAKQQGFSDSTESDRPSLDKQMPKESHLYDSVDASHHVDGVPTYKLQWFTEPQYQADTVGVSDELPTYKLQW